MIEMFLSILPHTLAADFETQIQHTQREDLGVYISGERKTENGL